MIRRKISRAIGEAALLSYLAGSRQELDVATAVRFLLEELGTLHPGGSVEVRVPPYGAVQCLAGPAHTRGTPSNVVELAPEAWIELAIGQTGFDELADSARLSASGNRSDLTGIFPIFVP